MLIPAAQNMIYATVLGRNVMMTKDIKFQFCLGMVPGRTTYTIAVLNYTTYYHKKIGR